MINGKPLEPPVQPEVVVPPSLPTFIPLFTMSKEELAKHVQNDVEYRNRK